MSQQALDLRRSIQIVRRHRLLVGVVTVLGIVIGCAYSVLKPPMLTSTALVVFAQSVQSSNAAAAAANGGSNTFTATLEVIASSNQVLTAALPDVRPSMSLQQLRLAVATGSVTGNIISISAKAKVAADAETTANAVADSYIKYVNAPTSPIGRQSASLLQPATSAAGTGSVEALIVDGFLGARGRLADRGHRGAGPQPPGQAAPGARRDRQFRRTSGPGVVPGGPPVGRRWLDPAPAGVQAGRRARVAAALGAAAGGRAG